MFANCSFPSHKEGVPYEYRSSLYQAQTTNNLDTLVSVFEKCQFRLDIKLSDFFELIDQVSKEVNQGC